jgi:uncharacterized cupin superfamily protein
MSANDHSPGFHDDTLSEAQQRVQAELRAMTPPVARDEFRAELRERFVQGSLEETGVDTPVPRVVARPRARRLLRWTVPLATAAALVLMFSSVNRGSAWEVMRVSAGTEVIMLDGKGFSCDDLDPIEAALHPGCKILVPEGGQMEVISEGNLLLQLNGGVAVTLPTPPSRWFRRALESEFSGEGTLRVATGDQFAGTRYRIHSQGVDLEITGTAFAVIQTADETCICVLDGEVVATMSDGSTRSIAAGRRLTINRVTGSFEEGEMHSGERDELSDLQLRADHIS